MPMTIKARIKRLLPPSVYNSIMLRLPILYQVPPVNWETNLTREGIEDVLRLLDSTLTLEGDIIECGSSRCGTSIIIARYLRDRANTKKVYAFDSFEGFDREELARERSLGLAQVSEDAFTSVTYEYVLAKIRRCGFEDTVIPVKGFFEETLPRLSPDGRFCFVFIDCDLRHSMTYCAVTLWPRIVPGGLICFDDYGSDDFKGARLAVDDFVSRSQEGIDSHGVLSCGYYVRKKG